MTVNDRRSFRGGHGAEICERETDGPAQQLDPIARLRKACGPNGLDAFVEAAQDMLNWLIEVDRQWVFELVTTLNIRVSPAIVEAARSGLLPFRFTPDKNGEFHTSMMGMFNALFDYIGVESDLWAIYKADTETKQPTYLHRFEAWRPNGNVTSERKGELT